MSFAKRMMQPGEVRDDVRFRTKMMIAFTVMLALAFGVGGSALISTSTENSFSQLQESAANAHRLIQYTLSAVGGVSRTSQNGGVYDDLIDTLMRLGSESGRDWYSLRLSDSEDVIYVNREPDAFKNDIIGSVDSEQFAILMFRSETGAYLLQIAGEFRYGTTTMYLESLYDLSTVFAGRQYQLVIYRQLFAVVIALGAAISWLLSFWMTTPLRRLSRVTRTIASGDLSCRVSFSGKDEIGVLAADFNNMAERLEININEMKDTMQRQEEFMGGLAHEMKTPMTSIIGYADLLRGHALSDEDKRDAANYIFMEGRRLEVLSLKLLDLIVLKKRDFTLLQISIGYIVKDVARLLQPAMEKLEIRLGYDCDDSECMLEPDLFMSLLINLVDNARKALEPGGEIFIRSKTLGEKCEISVTDNGKGIPADELSKIKDAFYRVDKSRSRAQGGVGLGLRLCDEIASLHDGEIVFESELGKGTTVTITLKSAKNHG